MLLETAKRQAIPALFRIAAVKPNTTLADIAVAVNAGQIKQVLRHVQPRGQIQPAAPYRGEDLGGAASIKARLCFAHQ